MRSGANNGVVFLVWRGEVGLVLGGREPVKGRRV